MRHALVVLALLAPLTAVADPLPSAGPARVLTEDPPQPGEPLDGWEALAPPAERSPDEILDVDEAVALALQASPDLRAAGLAVDVARGVRIDAGAIANPTWEVEVLERHGEHVEKGALGVELEVDVTDVFLAPARGAAVAPVVDAARLRERDAANRLRYEVQAAYYEHQAATTGWSAALRSVDALAASRDTWRAIVAAGNAPLRDLALREVAYEEARIRAAELEIGALASRERLSRLLGTAPGSLSPALPPAPAELSLPDDVEADALAASLDLRALDADLQAARRTATLARVEALAPDLDLFVETDRFAGGETTAAGVAVSVPLFAFGAGDAIRTSAEADILEARRDATVVEVRSSARETQARLQSAHRRALHYQEVVLPARELVLQETLLHYNAMQVGIDQLLDAWRQRVEAEIAYADTLRELWTARAALDALLDGSRVDAPRAAASAATSTESGGH